MTNSKQTLIGKVKSISGSLLSIQLDESVKSTMPIIGGLLYRIGQLGSFVRIPLGYVHLYGVVTKIGADAIPEALRLRAEEESKDVRFSTRWVSVLLIGERIGAKFERGVVQFPTADDEVHLVTLDDSEIIYSSYADINSITVGNISVSESLPAKIELDKLVTRHCAILGATGSGKSNAVAVIMEAIASGKYKSARILVIDPHGEYNDSLKDFSKVFKVGADVIKGQNELLIPFWALPFNELLSSFAGNLSEINRDYVREKILEKKIQSSKNLSVPPPELTITADSPIPFSLNQLWYELDDFERQTFTDNGRINKSALVTQGDPCTLKHNVYPPASLGSAAPFINNRAKGILSFLDAMRNRILDQRFRFLFNAGDLAPDLKGKITIDLDSLLENWLSHEKPITILDLSGIPSEVMTSISGSILKIVYDALFWSQNLPVGGRKQPLLIVLEEAHNYLKAGENSISSRTVQTIAKEGRKYGVGLLLVTQRPTELDETVLSQCGTLVALRMSNKGDRGHVSAVVQDELYDMVGLLPSLRTGEGLILGEAVKIPSRVKFTKIANAPRSSDPCVSDEWTKEKPEKKHYAKLLEYWRSQKFSE